MEGLGEEHNAKLKLRFGLNLKNYKFYTKLRFRTEPISPFDIGDGLSCAGKVRSPDCQLALHLASLQVPLPLYVLPVLRKIPLRIEYRVRINAARSDAVRKSRLDPLHDRKVLPFILMQRLLMVLKVYVSTGLGAIDVSLDELNVCLEYDEYAPLWDLGIVRTERKRPFKEKKFFRGKPQ